MCRARLSKKEGSDSLGIRSQAFGRTDDDGDVELSSFQPSQYY